MALWIIHAKKSNNEITDLINEAEKERDIKKHERVKIVSAVL